MIDNLLGFMGYFGKKMMPLRLVNQLKLIIKTEEKIYYKNLQTKRNRL